MAISAIALYSSSLVPSRCILIFLSFLILSPMSSNSILSDDKGSKKSGKRKVNSEEFLIYA